ncbi:MAG: hypothetical protein ACE5G8_17825, partial [Anaerolineae bacterium]
TADLGTLYLLLRNAVITGTLTGSGGSPATGVPVLAWREGSPGILHTRSGPNGRYALFVSPGEWHVRPAPAL